MDEPGSAHGTSSFPAGALTMYKVEVGVLGRE